MKKVLFVVAMASVALASCSKDEQSAKVAKGNPDVIGFKSSILSVRGAEIGNDLASMQVTAFDTKDALYFNETEFTKEAGSSSFKSNPEHRWPGDGSKVKFYCYAPSSDVLGGSVSLKAGEKKMTAFSPKTAVKDQTDFVAACVEGTKADGNGVVVGLNHQLSQIKLMAKCNNRTYSCKVAGVRIGRPVAKGDFTFPDVGAGAGVWNLSQDEGDKPVYEFTFNSIDLNDTAQSLMADNGGAMLIPQTLTPWDATDNPKNTTDGGKKRGAYISVKLVATSTAGKVLFDGWSAVPVPADTKWEAGKTYIYTLDYTNGLGKADPDSPEEPDKPKPGDDILGGNVSFKVTVTAWTVEEKDIDVK